MEKALPCSQHPVLQFPFTLPLVVVVVVVVVVVIIK